jgi:hypothetical protein
MAVVVKNWPGHAFFIPEWDDDRQDSEKKYKGAFVCKNSSDSFPTFYIPYDLIDCLFTTIEIILTDTALREIRERNDTATVAYAIEQGITNGGRLDDRCTRAQFAVLLVRLKHPVMDYHTAIWQAIVDWLFNGENTEDSIIREHMMIMCGRYLGASWSDQECIQKSIDMWITTGAEKERKAKRIEAILMVARLHKVFVVHI